MALSSPGIGSNLDVNSIVTQLMSIEQQPLVRLQQKEATYQAKLSAMGSIKSALSTFQTSAKALADTDKFLATRATAADTTVASATTGTTAVAGSYTLEVTKLAQAQKLAAAGQTDTVTALSTGTITFDFGTVDASGGSFNSTTGKYTDATFTSSGTGAKTVVIDSTNNTLTGIRDAINSAKIGVTATIVNDGSSSPYRLVLTDSSTGKANSMKISVSDAGTLQDFLSHDPADNSGQALTETVSAQNAEFKVDGISASKASNTVSDVIQGVTLNLLKTNSGTPTKITVDRDATAITATINSFVTAHNQLKAKLKELTAFNTTTQKAATLTGDATVRTIQTQLDNLLSAPLTDGSNPFTQLSEIGVTKQRDGSLALSETKLKTAIDTDFSSIAGLFAAVGTPTDSLTAYKSSTSATQAGVYTVNISAIATQGTATGGSAPGLTIDATNNTLDVELDGVTATVTLASGSPYASATALAAEVQSKINGASAFSTAGLSVTASVVGGAITLTSARYGSTSGINITGGNGSANLMGSAAVTAGVDVAGTIHGVTGTGSGQFLTGAAGAGPTDDDAKGLKLQVTGGVLGARGSVTFGRGYASQLDVLITSFLAEDGPLTARTQGLNTTLKSLSAEKVRISDRLVGVEDRYRKQFTALDKLMNSMTNTSSFLTQQLSVLSQNS